MLSEEDKAWMLSLDLDEPEIAGNLSQPTTPERRSQAINLARERELPVDTVERNLTTLSQEDQDWMQGLQIEIPEVTNQALLDPDLGPAIKDDIDSFSYTERFLMDTIQRFKKGIGVVKMGEIGTAMMNGTVTEAQLAELAEVRESLETPFMQVDYGFNNPVADVAMFITGAVTEVVPIMGYMLWESKEEAVQGAIAGTLMGAAASVPTAGAVAPVTAAGGAVVGVGVGLKVGMSKAMFTMEAGNAYLEYIAMRDKETGEFMDKSVARGAATIVGLANAALELVAFERLLRTIPGMDKVIQGFSRGGMKKLLSNSTARSALMRFGANVGSVSAVEGITESAQETLTILGGIVAAQVAPGEYDTATLGDAMKQIGHAGLQGMAGGGGLAVPGSGAGAYMDLRKERAAASNLEKLMELERMAKESLVAERLPADFKSHLLRVRDVHGEATQTLVELARLQTFFQEAGLTDEQVAQRMPETWASMEEAELSGVEVLIPYQELGAELARMETFDALAPDIRVTAEGMTSREAEQVVSEREAVYEEYAKLAGREEAHEGATQRVYEDVLTMLVDDLGMAQSAAEAQATLQAEWWERAGPRVGMNPFDAYKAYSGLSVGRLSAAVLEGQGFERSDAIIGRVREGAYPTQQQMFGATLTEFLRANGGLIDEGGELAARDATNLMRTGPNAMSFEEAHQRAIEAGFMSEESWTDKSQGDLLELIDQDLHGGGVHRLGGGDTKFQDVAQEMSELEELLDQMDVDIQTMTNEEVRGAIEAASYFQGLGKHLMEGDYSKLDKASKAAVDEAIEESDYPDQLREALELHKDTAWAYQAIAGAKARIAIRHIIAGTDIPFDSVFDNPQVQKTRRILEKGGEAAIKQILVARTMIGQAGKPVNAVNGSFIDCAPSKNCAKYCYATGNNYKYAANIIKGELIAMFVQADPAGAAELIASQYSPFVPDPRPGRPAVEKALRLFDKGDGNMQWIPVIKELNKRGISVQIFSKRPEFLRAVPEQNWRMLSVDSTNFEMADENMDLDLAMVYEGTDAEIAWMNERTERIAVILPIMGKGTKAEKKAMVDKIPDKLKKKKCPIDSGITNVTNGNVKWNCQRCDAGGGVGCYNEKTTASKTALNESFPVLVVRAEKAGVMAEVEELRDGLSGRERELLDTQLAALVSEARAGYDAETARDPEIEISGAVERAIKGAGALRTAGRGAIKKLYQWHGGALDFDVFDPRYLGTGEGTAAFGWGFYFADRPGTAEHYRQVALEKMREREAELLLLPLHGMLGEIAKEVTGAEPPGFMVGDLISAAVLRAGVGTKATIVAELKAGMEAALKAEARSPGTLTADELMRLGPEWSMAPSYQAAIHAVETGRVIGEILENLHQANMAPGQIYDVSLEIEEHEWFLMDPPINSPEMKASMDKLLALVTSYGAPYKAVKERILHMQEIGLRGMDMVRALAVGPNSLGSDYQVSMLLQAAGFKGNKFHDFDTRNRVDMALPEMRGDRETFNYVVFDGADVTIRDRLFQEKMGSPRGFITMDETKAWFKITLTEKADMSTFLHESGHFFLEMMQRMSESPDATADLKADLAIIREWMELEPGQPITTENHEAFARAFEQYLMNGEAPSLALREAFIKFKAWLKNIYKRLSALNVDMTPELRGVFDRMLATDAQIAEARKAMDFAPVFESAEAAGMSAEQFHTYQRMLAKAMQGAADDLELKALAEQKRHFTEEYKELRKAMQAEVEARVNADPVQMLKHLLRTGKMLDGSEVPLALQGLKLNSQSLMTMYPHRKILQRLVGLHSKAGQVPDLVATEFGFESGDAMVQAVLKAPPRKKLIEQATDAAMKKAYGDMMNDGSMEAAAIQSMHADPVSTFLLTELKALARQARAPDTRPLDVIKQVAQERVASMKIQDLTPGRYRQAEARESRKAIELAAKGDFVGAHEAKRKQLLNHWLFRYITTAREATAKQRDYLKRFDTKKVRQRMGRAGRESYLDAIDVYLDGIELRKTPLRALGQRQSLKDWIAARQGADEAVQIPERLQYEANLKNFKQLTVTEFGAIHDAVKNIEHLANLKNKLLLGKEKRDFNEAKDTLIEKIYETQKSRPEEVEQNRRFWSRKWHQVLRWQAELLKPETIARWIDGETSGPAHRMIFQPFVDAQIASLDMQQEYAMKVDKILRGMSKEQRARMTQKFDVFGISMTGEEVIALALNMGNAGNLKKLLKGYPTRGWTEETLRARLAEIMTLEDWHSVQAIWDTIEELKGPIFALNERMTGLPPPAVEALGFTVEGVTFRGGYYPIVYDRTKSAKAAKDTQKKEAPSLFENNFLRPNVSKGFTETRTEYVGPLQLSLDVLPGHLAETIHFITHYEAVTQVNKLLHNKDVVEALRDTFGEEIQKIFLPWLQSIASASVVPDHQEAFASILKQMRHGTSVMAMGYKLSTAMMQAFGFFTTVDQIGVKATLEGMMEAAAQLGAGKRVFEDINAKSGEVRHAMRTFDRDARQVIELQLRKTGAAKQWTKFQGYTFALMGMVQKFVNMATWYGAYSKGIKEGMTEERATQYGDASVRQSQSAAGPKDLAAIQRGSEGLQAISMFYTFFSQLHQRLSETGRQMKGKQRIKGTPNVIARLTWLVMLPVFMEVVVRREWPDEDEEPIEFWLKRVLLYGTVTIPILRDVANGVFSDYGYSVSPVAQTGKRIVGGLTGIWNIGGNVLGLHDEELTDAQMRGIMDTIGVTAKLPTGQLWILYNWLKRAEADELENPLHELIYKARRE